MIVPVEYTVLHWEESGFPLSEFTALGKDGWVFQEQFSTLGGTRGFLFMRYVYAGSAGEDETQSIKDWLEARETDAANAEDHQQSLADSLPMELVITDVSEETEPAPAEPVVDLAQALSDSLKAKTVRKSAKKNV